MRRTVLVQSLKTAHNRILIYHADGLIDQHGVELDFLQFKGFSLHW